MKDKKVSEDKVFQYYQKGLPEDFQLKGAKSRRQPVDLKGATVQISMKIDYNLLKAIKEAAAVRGIPYQTFMKWALRDYLEHRSLEERVQKIEAQLASITK